MRERLARLRDEVSKRPDIELGADGLPIGAADEVVEGEAAEGGRGHRAGRASPSNVRKSS
jgi:hypothetical protein